MNLRENIKTCMSNGIGRPKTMSHSIGYLLIVFLITDIVIVNYDVGL